MKADLIIPVYNQLEFTKACLESIRKNTLFKGYHLVVIDNASTDDTLKWLLRYRDANMTIISNGENLGFVKAINQGIELSRADYVGFLNNDIEVSKGWLTNLIEILASDKTIGAVGPICSSNHDWQGFDRVKKKFKVFDVEVPEDFKERSRIISEKFKHKYIRVRGMLAFFCTILPSGVVRKIGLLDEGFYYLGDDDDYARRLERAGYWLGLSLGTYIKHGSQTTGKALHGEKITKYQEQSLKRLKEKHPEYYGR